MKEQTGRQPLLLFSLHMLCVEHSSYYPLAACLRRYLWAGLALLALRAASFVSLPSRPGWTGVVGRRGPHSSAALCGFPTHLCFGLGVASPLSPPPSL